MSTAISTTSRPRSRTVLVTGANGYIGCAVSKAFARAGWRVFGLVRRPEATTELELGEVIPIVGKLDDLNWVDGLLTQSPTFDVLVNSLEAFPGYEALFDQLTTLFRELANSSNRRGVRPLVLWSSGSKDYGLGPLHGDPGLTPQSEDTPINPPMDAIRQRAEGSLKIFDHKDAFDGVVLRPTTVYGYSCSYYGTLIDFAAAEAAKGEPALRILADPNVPMHAAHVDDCAEAYVALAEHDDRAAVAGQIFNIAGYRYETAREIGEALAAEYGFPQGINFVTAEEAGDWFPRSVQFTFNFPQCVSTDKIRKLTGWNDKRMLFSENMRAYRIAYEAEDKKGHENIGVARNRMRQLGEIGIRSD